MPKTLGNKEFLQEINVVDFAAQNGYHVNYLTTQFSRQKGVSPKKMVLNMLSTATMIKLGKVYGNLMVDVRASNEKLVERCVRIVRTATGADSVAARNALEQCGYSAKTAILMILCKIDAPTAEARLEKTHGRIAEALNNL